MEHRIDKQPLFEINPNLRLRFPHFKVELFLVDDEVLREEAYNQMPDRRTYVTQKQCVICVLKPDHSSLDILYSERTEFNNMKLQNWLRETIRDQVILRAQLVLPKRVHEWEKVHHLKAKGIIVKKLRKGVLGQCTHDNVIHLAPFLVIFPQEYIDDVIQHEMAHFKHKHHRKSFWACLSKLLGKDAYAQKILHGVVLAKYMPMYQFLMK